MHTRTDAYMHPLAHTHARATHARTIFTCTDELDALRFFLGSYELLTDASKFTIPGTNDPGYTKVFSVHSDSKFT